MFRRAHANRGDGIRASVRAPSPHEAQRNRNRTEFTATSANSLHLRMKSPSGETAFGREESTSRLAAQATAFGSRTEPSRRAAFGSNVEDGGLLSGLENQIDRRGNRANGRPSGRAGVTEQWCGADGPGATPTGLSEDGSTWHQNRWLGQPGQREGDISDNGTGNRRPSSKSGIARRVPLGESRRAM